MCRRTGAWVAPEVASIHFLDRHVIGCGCSSGTGRAVRPLEHMQSEWHGAVMAYAPDVLRLTQVQCCEGLTSIVVMESGRVRMEVVGEHRVDDDSEDGCDLGLVVYQKGLTPAPWLKRCHHSLLSTYKIKYGDQVANVPWANFAWIKSNKASDMMRVAQCTDCSRDDCVKCFETLTSDDIMVVWIHGPSGERTYQWYVAFKHKNNVLTRVPSHFCSGIVARSSIAGFCKCGRCKHPLHDMINSRSRSRSEDFDRRALTFFSELRKRVNATKGNEKSCAPKSSKGHATFVEDTCAICLEDTFVNTACCVHKRCSIKVCTECHGKTRGLCPLCDRSKLSKAVGFMCHACNHAVPLDEFGHECLSCKECKLCSRCFKNFAVCGPCENDIIRNVNKKRKCNDSA